MAKEIKCKHEYIEDERFKDGSVMMIFGNIGNLKCESRFICKLCGHVKYEEVG